MNAANHTLAEEYLLLALDDRTGRAMLDSTKLHIGIAAGAVTQLVLDGNLELATGNLRLPGGGKARAGRFFRTTQAAPSDPLVGKILQKSVGATPKTAISRVGGVNAWTNLARSLKAQLLGSLTAEGVLRKGHRKVFGLFGTTSWKPDNGSVETEIRTRALAALDAGSAPDPRTGALIALLSASGLLPKVFPERDRKEIEAAGKQVSQGNFAAEGVKKAIEEVQAAVMIAVIMPGIAGGAPAN
jgi:hypothetical protein